MMKNLAIIGGMGSGKTTLAEAITAEDPKIHRVSMSDYGLRIPMTLIATTHSQLLSLPKSEYIETIVLNQGIELLSLRGKRLETDEFQRTVLQQYGPTAVAETVLKAINPEAQNLIGNIYTFNNALCLKNKGFCLVGLSCKFSTKTRRYLKRKKGIRSTDQRTWHEIERHIIDSDRRYGISKSMQLTDVFYDSSRKIGSEGYFKIAREILAATR